MVYYLIIADEKYLPADIISPCVRYIVIYNDLYKYLYEKNIFWIMET